MGKRYERTVQYSARRFHMIFTHAQWEKLYLAVRRMVSLSFCTVGSLIPLCCLFSNPKRCAEVETQDKESRAIDGTRCSRSNDGVADCPTRDFLNDNGSFPPTIEFLTSLGRAMFLFVSLSVFDFLL